MNCIRNNVRLKSSLFSSNGKNKWLFMNRANFKVIYWLDAKAIRSSVVVNNEVRIRHVSFITNINFDGPFF